MTDKKMDPIFKGIAPEPEMDIFEEDIESTGLKQEGPDLIKEMTPEPKKLGLSDRLINWISSFFDVTILKPHFEVTQAQLLKRL